MTDSAATVRQPAAVDLGQHGRKSSFDASPVVSSDRVRRLCGIFFVVALAVPLAYALITGHVWEDYLITYRHSENLVNGHGLVYQPGERVHGFTSPLGVLLPALFQWVIRGESYLPALWCFRVLGALAFALAGTLLLRQMLREYNPDRWSPLVFALLYLCEAKSVAFSVNGQESSLMMLFLALGLLAAYKGINAAWGSAGLAWAGLMWTRPDGCVYIAGLAVVGLVFSRSGWRESWKGTLRAGLICAVVYLPWFLFAWEYYGSPVPHTIVAKGLSSAFKVEDPVRTSWHVFRKYYHTMKATFQPIYSGFGGWPTMLLNAFGLVCGAVATVYWMLPTRDRLTRMASLLFTLGCLYMSAAAVAGGAFPWYFPVVALPGTFVIARAVHELVAMVPGLARLSIVSRLIQVFLVATALYLLVATTVQIRIQQKEIEDGTRTKVGLWLREHVKPGERVYLEPLGYIGYFSGAKMLDWPGLVAPEVIKVRREVGDNWPTVIATLKPEWLVLRPNEVEQLLHGSKLLDAYVEMCNFDASERLASYAWIPGRQYLEFDSRFTVFRRVADLPTK